MTHDEQVMRQINQAIYPTLYYTALGALYHRSGGALPNVIFGHRAPSPVRMPHIEAPW